MTLRAILFDMDGTLTVPHIDFPALRTRVGVPEGRGLMEHVYALPAAAAERAEAIIRQVEMEAALAAVASDGLAELFARLDALPLKRALITNNHRAAMDCVVAALGLRFDALLSREDGLLKPAPDLLVLALDRLGVAADQSVFVGDGRYDRMAAQAAGVRYVHLARSHSEPVDGSVIYGLVELLDLLGPGV